jgi:hypothetical protein
MITKKNNKLQKEKIGKSANNTMSDKGNAMTQILYTTQNRVKSAKKMYSEFAKS